MFLAELFHAKQSLYCSRPVLDNPEFKAWVAEYFTQALPPADWHVTIAYSKTPVDWSDLQRSTADLTIEAGSRSLMHLGEKGAVVLQLTSSALQQRWEAFRDAGASWDWPAYHPHITITYYGPEDLDMPAFSGKLILGPERFAEVEENPPRDEIKVDADGFAT